MNGTSRKIGRAVTLIACLTVFSPLPVLADPAVLHESVVVDGDLVHLGDLFANAGDKADVAVAYAPAPGKRAVLDAKWLYRVAYAHGLDWRPMSTKDRAVVERRSTLIETAEIERAILAALADKGAEPDMEVELANSNFTVHVPGDAAGLGLEVEDAAYDPATRRFTVILGVPAGDSRTDRVRVNGRLHRVVEVPVLTRRVLKDEVIAEADVRWLRMRADRVQNDVVTNVSDLIGKTPRQGVREGAPVRSSDVRLPILVRRGGLVTIVLQAPRMTLTAIGQALEDGSDCFGY